MNSAKLKLSLLELNDAVDKTYNMRYNVVLFYSDKTNPAYL